MRQDLDEKLVKTFPNLYRDRHESMAKTCLCWGFPGDGWFDLLWKASEKLEALILAQPEEDRHHYRASQVKEKFGTLRFYMKSETEEMSKVIREAEMESGVTCEVCGKPGKMVGKGWIYTACEEHTRKEKG